MNIIGYTWEAGIQCVDCTCQALEAGILKTDDPDPVRDQHKLPMDMVDRRGNGVGAVYNVEDDRNYCDTCGDDLR